MLPPDERPLLVCRVDCPPPLQEELDGWTPWHFDDFGRHYAVLGASSYKIIRDFDPETGLPAAFNASQATRFIPYVATSIPDMHAWIGSEVVTGGLDEPTLERESKYPSLEEEPFNGTMMTISKVVGALGRDQAGSGGCVVERFEVGPEHEAEFDEWLEGSPPIQLRRVGRMGQDSHLPGRSDRRLYLSLEPLPGQGQPDGLVRVTGRC